MLKERIEQKTRISEALQLSARLNREEETEDARLQALDEMEEARLFLEGGVWQAEPTDDSALLNFTRSKIQRCL